MCSLADVHGKICGRNVAQVLTFGGGGAGGKGRGQLGRMGASLLNSPEEWEKRGPTPGPKWRVLLRLSKEKSKWAGFWNLL